MQQNIKKFETKDIFILCLIILISIFIQYKVFYFFDRRDEDFGIILILVNLFFIILSSHTLKSALLLKYVFWVSFCLFSVFLFWFCIIFMNSPFLTNLPYFIGYELLFICLYGVYYLTLREKISRQ